MPEKYVATGALRSHISTGYGHIQEVKNLLKTFWKRHKILLLALVLGLSAFLLSYNALSFYLKTEKVVVTVHDMKPYQKISRSDLKMIDCPVGAIHRRCVRNIEEAVGSYTASPVFAGEMLLDMHLISAKNQPGISWEIGSEERGIFIPAQLERAVGGKISSGDLVDLIWTRKSAGHYEEYEPVGAITVLTNARVLETVSDDSSGELRGIVIAVSPIICEKLAHYIETGTIYVCLVPWSMNDHLLPTEAEVWPIK